MNREEAIKILQNPPRVYDEKMWEAIDMAIEVLSEQNKLFHDAYEQGRFDAKEESVGEWIKATGMMPPEFHGHHCCSKCGNFANMEPPFGNREDLSKFCPSCGVKMRNGYGGNNE